jgi:hypothetical protein
VDALELLVGRRRRLDALEPGPAGGFECGFDRDQPARVLGVRAGVVEVRRRMGEIERQLADTVPRA